MSPTTSLGGIEIAVRERRAFDAFETTHLQRATCEDGFGVLIGRENVRDAAIAAVVADGCGPVTVLHDLGEMIVFDTGGWRSHRWARYEGGRIAAETLVVDGTARARVFGRDVRDEAFRIGTLSPMHSALGELRSGRGQLGTSTDAVLPRDFPAAARPIASSFHRIWNARAFHTAAPCRWRGPNAADGDEATYAAWQTRLVAALPDAAVMIERGVVATDRVALLWRLHAHHTSHSFDIPATGQRIRAIGSSVFTLEDGVVVAHDMMIDELAIAAQLHRPIIDYV